MNCLEHNNYISIPNSIKIYTEYVMFTVYYSDKKNAVLFCTSR